MAQVTLNYGVGQLVHYYTGNGEQCHAAFIAENYIFDDVEQIPVTADIIQGDTVDVLGVIVPLRRDTVSYDQELTTEGTWHLPCPRANP